MKSIRSIISTTLALALLGVGATVAAATEPSVTIDGAQQTELQAEQGTEIDPDATFTWENGVPTLGEEAGGGIISPLYAKTWKYSGDFKAALSSSSFKNLKTGIKVTVKGTNCQTDYPNIYFSLRVQETIGWSTVGTRKKVPCGVTKTYTYDSARAGTYIMYFQRTGPTEHDEALKHVAGTVYYW